MLITLKAVKGFTGLTNQEVKILSLSVSSFAAFFREEEQRRNTMLKKESLMKTRWISLGLWETAAETKKPNLIIVLLYIVLKKTTTNTLS